MENAVAGSETPGGGPGVVRVTGNDGANVLEVTKGNSTLVGGGGIDVLTGGPHADAIDARDGLADRIVCKAGADTVQADAVDDVAGDCESVTRVAAPVTPTPTPGPVTPPTRKPNVRAFEAEFIARAALRGAEIGRLEEIRSFKGLRSGSTITLRCLTACSRKVRVVKKADKRGRARLVVRGGLVLRKATRVECGSAAAASARATSVPLQARDEVPAPRPVRPARARQPAASSADHHTIVFDATPSTVTCTPRPGQP